ncbi:hypothetical protein GCM10010174_90430 [Kutzneria viridogrisea]|uniref:Uncharacterized protein n=2 Tax=Kutzneria TaxID=43356 RepID=W5VZ99_9PSEU|nr:hypothetical protein [Kutzneria albida]AHH93902.1 hypothetical protein KALB_526 [Kutzneria albida DSM 43870]MBA8931093.1 hypothetical protein [Kutzneria viridogrisea]
MSTTDDSMKIAATPDPLIVDEVEQAMSGVAKVRGMGHPDAPPPIELDPVTEDGDSGMGHPDKHEPQAAPGKPAEIKAEQGAGHRA